LCGEVAGVQRIALEMKGRANKWTFRGGINLRNAKLGSR
jgi:hypothetical protein